MMIGEAKHSEEHHLGWEFRRINAYSYSYNVTFHGYYVILLPFCYYIIKINI